MKWEIMFRMGWTPQQVDALTQEQYDEFFAIRDGMIKAKVWR